MKLEAMPDVLLLGKLAFNEGKPAFDRLLAEAQRRGIDFHAWKRSGMSIKDFLQHSKRSRS